MSLCPRIGAVYLHREAVDFRKSINGLSAIVEQSMALDPYTGALFVFRNRRCDKLKVLYWDRSGFCLWYKRLERERFRWPRKHHDAVIYLSAEQLDWLLRGFDISQMQAHQKLHYQSDLVP